MTKLKDPVRMATIGAPHGVKGEVRVGRRFDIV